MSLSKKYLMLIRKDKGQTLFMGIIFSFLLISIVSYGIYKGSGIYEKIKAQNIADAAAYSGAVTQAKILNAIAALNEGIIFITNLVVKIVVIWLALKACCALCFIGFCYCAPIEKTYSRLAKPLLKLLKNIAWAMSDIQDFLMKNGKWLVIDEIKRIAKLSGAKSVITYPERPIPGLPESLKFKFNLIRANKAKDLAESSLSKEAIKFSTEDRDKIMTCYTKKWGSHEYEHAKSYYYKVGFSKNIEWTYSANDYDDKIFDKPKGQTFSSGKNASKVTFSFSNAKTIACKKISKILTKGYKLPSPLIKKSDFNEKQKILVYIKTKSIENVEALKTLRTDDHGFSAFAQSEPFGSTMFDMEWDARLDKISLVKKLSRYIPLLGSVSDELINH